MRVVLGSRLLLQVRRVAGSRAVVVQVARAA